MKQLLFLLLFPCLAMAQYPGNGNQKISLGEQTTADGLVFRGVASIDTVTATSKITRANKLDTSAFILLDTVTNLLWHYKTASNGWIQAGGGVSVSSFSAGSTGLTPSTATTGAVTLGGTLAVANGGTGQSTLAAAAINTGSGTLNYLPKYTANGTTLGNSSIFDNGNVGIGTANPGVLLHVLRSDDNAGTNNIRISSNGDVNKFGFFEVNSAGNYTRLGYWKNPGFGNVIIQDSNVGIGTDSPQSGYRLHVVDSIYVGGNVSASAYTTRSDYDLKDEIQNISYGINEVMQMQPVKYTYKSNGSTQLGFIAQDLGVITPEVVSFEDKMSVYYNALIPILTKAIQEQQALIKALEQRILTLENK